MTAAQRELLLGPDKKKKPSKRPPRVLTMEQLSGLSDQWADVLRYTSQMPSEEGGAENPAALIDKTLQARPSDFS